MYIYVLYRHYYRHKHTYTALWRYCRSAVASTKRLHRPKSVGRSHEAPLVEYFKRPPSFSVHSILPLVLECPFMMCKSNPLPYIISFITIHTLQSIHYDTLVVLLQLYKYYPLLMVCCVYWTIVPACYGGVVFSWKNINIVFCSGIYHVCCVEVLNLHQMLNNFVWGKMLKFIWRFKIKFVSKQ